MAQSNRKTSIFLPNNVFYIYTFSRLLIQNYWDLCSTVPRDNVRKRLFDNKASDSQLDPTEEDHNYNRVQNVGKKQKSSVSSSAPTKIDTSYGSKSVPDGQTTTEDSAKTT